MSHPPADSFPSAHPPAAEAYVSSVDHTGAPAQSQTSESAAYSYQGHYPEQYGLPQAPNYAYSEYSPASTTPAPSDYAYAHHWPPTTHAAYTYPYPQNQPAYPSTTGYQPGDYSNYHQQYAQWYPPPQQGTFPAYQQSYPYYQSYPDTNPPSQADPYIPQAAFNSHPSYSGADALVGHGQGPPMDWNQAQYMQPVGQSQASTQPGAASSRQTALPGLTPEGSSGRRQEMGKEGEQQAKRRRMSSFSDAPTETEKPADPEKVIEQQEPAGTSMVWVWDLDETLIIFQSLLTGKFADLEGMDDKRKAEGLKLGGQWERLILDISDTAMFFEQVEDFDQPSIGHVAEFDDGASIADFDFGELNLKKPLTDAGRQKLAYLYRHIQAVYAKGASQLLSGEKRAEWQALYGATDRYTGGWLSAGRRLLAECASARLEDPDQASQGQPDAVKEPGGPSPGKPTIVLVSAGQLIPTLTKCLLFRLDPWIDPANVYSSKITGKLQCFEWVHKRFGEGKTDTKFCVVGDGVEEQAAARMMKWPFQRVASGLDPEMRLPKVKIEQLLNLLSTQ